MESTHKVRAIKCEYNSAEENVYDALCRAARPLDAAWKRLREAETIIIKFNQDYPQQKVALFEGQRQDLVSDKVVRAVLRLLRENTEAELRCADISFYRIYHETFDEDTFSIREALQDYGVDYIDGEVSPASRVILTDTGRMFDQYFAMSDLVKPGVEIVSVAKAKSHGFTGFTGCLKNLFGLMPSKADGRPRTYYHHLIRLPYVLVDMGRMLNPALNIVDGLVGQAGSEWESGNESPVRMNTIIAGDNVVSTDAILLHLMGHDPGADWGSPPFHAGRNVIRIAAESGLGNSDINEIDFSTEVEPQQPGIFATHPIYKPQENRTLRRTMCEQALYYADNIEKFEQYDGEFILLQDGEIRWHNCVGKLARSRRDLANEFPDHAMWFKLVDMEETEGENYDIYRRTLEQM